MIILIIEKVSRLDRRQRMRGRGNGILEDKGMSFNDK
jgi:hypothetical protein